MASRRFPLPHPGSLPAALQRERQTVNLNGNHCGVRGDSIPPVPGKCQHRAFSSQVAARTVRKYYATRHDLSLKNAWIRDDAAGPRSESVFSLNWITSWLPTTRELSGRKRVSQTYLKLPRTRLRARVRSRPGPPSLLNPRAGALDWTLRDRMFLAHALDDALAGSSCGCSGLTQLFDGRSDMTTHKRPVQTARTREF